MKPRVLREVEAEKAVSLWTAMKDKGLASAQDVRILETELKVWLLKKGGNPQDYPDTELALYMSCAASRMALLRAAFPRRAPTFYRADGCPFCGRAPTLFTQRVPCGISGNVIGWEASVHCGGDKCGVSPTAAATASTEVEDKDKLILPEIADQLEQLKLLAIDRALNTWNTRPWITALKHQVKPS